MGFNVPKPRYCLYGADSTRQQFNSIQFNSALFQVFPEETEAKGFSRLTVASAPRGSQQVQHRKQNSKPINFKKTNCLQNEIVMK